MFTHFLVPLDGSHLAEAILPVTRYLAERLNARVTLLHVVEPAPPATIHGEAHLLNAADAEQYLARLAGDMAPSGVAVAWHVDVAAGGDVPKAIFSHGQELAADLIILTDHGRSGLKSVLVGGIAQQVLQSGKIPVMLGKAARGDAPGGFECRHILLPLDGSALYEQALPPAVEIARACGAALELLIVVPTLDTLSPERSAAGTILPSSTRAILDLSQNDATDYLDRQVTALREAGIQAHGQVLRGKVSTGILEAAERLPADLIVMATHGRAGLDAFWSGSVAPNVVNRTAMPVLLLRVEGPEPVR